MKMLIRSYFNINSWIYSDGSPITQNFGKQYGKKGSILIMELNLKMKQLRYYIDGVCPGAAVENVRTGKDIKYKLAVSMFDADVIMQIINFEFI